MKFWIFAIVGILACGSISAVADNRLYSGTVVVKDQSNTSRSMAAKTAMKEVLVRVSGDRAVLRYKKIQQALIKTQRYTRKFRYVREGDELFMNIEFEPTLINQLIESANFNVWSGRRPTTLFWLAEQTDDNKKRLFADSIDSLEMQTIERVAAERGLQILFPLMDFEEQQSVSVFDVWGRFDSVLMTASERYMSGQVVSARLFPLEIGNTMKWRVEWRLLHKNPAESGSHDASSKADALVHLMHQVADSTMMQFVNSSNNASDIEAEYEMVVDGLSTMEDYVEVVKLLSNIKEIQGSYVTAMDSGRVTFSISFTVSSSELMQELEMDGRLLKQRDEFGIALDSLSFDWRP